MWQNIGVILLLPCLISGGTLPPKKSSQLNGRIVGGTETTIEENPWQISLQIDGIHSCGGSIISADTILTAAHCVGDLPATFFKVVSGTADLTKGSTYSAVEKIVVHEDYIGVSHDAALIFLEEPLTFDATTKAVPLADNEPKSGSTVTVTGWGLLHEHDSVIPDILHSVDVQIVDREECSTDYGGGIDSSMICAGVPEGGKDSCSDDSGGPLTQDGVLVGVVSWGNGCAKAGFPGVYANVASIREWIRENSGI